MGRESVGRASVPATSDAGRESVGRASVPATPPTGRAAHATVKRSDKSSEPRFARVADPSGAFVAPVTAPKPEVRHPPQRPL
jgi:hypothetical protein